MFRLRTTRGPVQSCRCLTTMPEVKGLPLLGTTLSILASGGPSKLHLYVDNRHSQLGPIYREQLGPVAAVFVSDPNYMRRVFSLEGKYPKHVLPEAWLLYNETYKRKRGLLFMDDEEWHKYRKILNNIILKPNPDVLHQSVAVVTSNLVTNWVKAGKIENLEDQLYQWSLEVILSVLTGQQYDTHRSDLTPVVKQLSKVVHNIFIESANLSLIPAALAQKLNLPTWKRFTKAVDEAMKIGSSLIDKLHPLTESEPNLLQEIVRSGISKVDLERIVLDLILAAGDTTAYTTQWTLHLLARHPDVQTQLRTTITNNPEKEAMDLGLLKGALRETLRLYPVAPFVTRYMPDDVEIGGYQVKKGELVIMSLYTSGRNENHFPSASTFDPSRWLRQGLQYSRVTSPYASLPFAMGPRACIGRKIAETQILTLLTQVLNNLQLHTNQEEIDIKLNLISVPSIPIKLNITPLKLSITKQIF